MPNRAVGYYPIKTVSRVWIGREWGIPFLDGFVSTSSYGVQLIYDYEGQRRDVVIDSDGQMGMMGLWAELQSGSSINSSLCRRTSSEQSFYCRSSRQLFITNERLDVRRYPIRFEGRTYSRDVRLGARAWTHDTQ
jgi:hypothetical protein